MKTLDRERAAAGVIGSRPVRHDGVDKVTGRAIYGVDAEMANMLHGKVLRSPHAHARIVSIDTARAEALPGVHAVMTGEDLPDAAEGVLEANEQGVAPVRYKSLNMVARGKVLYHGHAIAAVAAVDATTAEEAVRLIDVTYEVLPPVLDVRAAMSADAPVLLPDLRTIEGGDFGGRGGVRTQRSGNIAQSFNFEEGDPGRGFAEADVVIEREFTFATVHQGYLEPHAATVFWRSDGQLIVECSTQGQFAVREELAAILRWPISKILVIPKEIGGGFGGKTTSWLETMAAILSRKSGRPVKMTMSRTEVLLASGPTSGGYARVKLGATNAGRLTALQGYFALEAGAFPPSPVLQTVMCTIPLYDLENFRVDGHTVVVNKPKTTAYRAPGSPHASFAVESVVDEICERLGLDRLEFRLRNAPKEGSLKADGTRLPRVGMIECLEAARRSEHWRTPLEQTAGVKRGRGIASGFWFNAGGLSSVNARLNSDGTVTLLSASVDIGGTRTSVALQLAETLGIPVADINPVVADTDSIAYSMLTGGSRVTFATGFAAHTAGLELKRQVVAGLATLWDIPAAEIVDAEGTFTAHGRTVTFKEAASSLGEAGIQCVAAVSTMAPAPGPAYAVHIADVEVDVETGKTRVLRYTAVQDAGKAVYPPYVEGQIQGGVAQGIGWALNEGYWYDDDGRLRNASFLDYRMPTTLDVPMIETILVEVPNPSHPFGVRGVGEVPIVPPLATIATAIHDATGIRMRDLPITPARLSAALAAGSQR